MDQNSSTESPSETLNTGSEGEDSQLHDAGNAGVEAQDTSGGESEIIDESQVGAEGEENGEGAGQTAADDESNDDKALRALVFAQMQPARQAQNQNQGPGQSGAGTAPGKLTTTLKSGVEKIKAKFSKEGYEFTDDLTSALDELLSPIASRLDEQDQRETSTREAQQARYDTDWNTCLDGLVEANPSAVKMLGSFGSGSANQQARKVVHDMALSFQRANPSLSGPKAFEKAVKFLFPDGASAPGKTMNQPSNGGNAGGNTRRVPPPQIKTGTQAKPGQVGKDGKPVKKTPMDAANAERLSNTERNRIANLAKGW